MKRHTRRPIVRRRAAGGLMGRRRRVGIALALIAVAVVVRAHDASALSRADDLYEADLALEAIDVLERLLAAARSGPERAEVLWRLSRAAFAVGETMERSGADTTAILAMYERGERYGLEAVAADPENHLGYFWQSASLGRWGQAKGILDALHRATPTRDLLRETIDRDPKHAASYHVLGQLYAQVPGVISFGDIDSAVSLARKSIDLHEEEIASEAVGELEHEYYIELASHLIDRNWSARKRAREQETKRRAHARTNDRFEQARLYEGIVSIPDVSDRQEAEGLLRDMIRRLRDIPDHREVRERRLERALGLLAGL